MTYRSLSIIVLLVFLAACSTRQDHAIPLSVQLPSTADNYSIIWVGTGKAYRFENGEYLRTEANDYAFEVIQRRYDNAWHSIKNMHRLHPDYDGQAGEREQTLFFGMDFTASDNEVVSAIRSSLGEGRGVSDAEFRQQVMTIDLAHVSAFAPFNTMRITQHYQYEEGLLVETVDLFKAENGKEIPFVRIEEEAVIFRPTRLAKAPTFFKSDATASH